jgi:hypothetical protein
MMVPNFKQNKYMLQGIQKVEQLERELSSLEQWSISIIYLNLFRYHL